MKRTHILISNFLPMKSRGRYRYFWMTKALDRMENWELESRMRKDFFTELSLVVADLEGREYPWIYLFMSDYSY